MTKKIVKYSGKAYLINWYGSGHIVAKIPYIEDHPVLGNCEDVRTSLIEDVLTDGTIITMNTEYQPMSTEDGYVFHECSYEDIVNQKEYIESIRQ